METEYSLLNKTGNNAGLVKPEHSYSKADIASIEVKPTQKVNNQICLNPDKYRIPDKDKSNWKTKTSIVKRHNKLLEGGMTQ